MKMDNKTEICDYIVEQRAMGVAWQTISEEVESKFGKLISPSNLYNMHSRYVKKLTARSALKNRIIQTYARTHNKVLTASLCGSSKWYVYKELEASADYLNKVEKDLKEKTMQMINKDSSIESISKELAYNGTPLSYNIIGSIYAEMQLGKVQGNSSAQEGQGN